MKVTADVRSTGIREPARIPDSSEITLAGPAEAVFAKVSKLGVSIEADAQASTPGGPFVLKGNCVEVW